MKPSRPPLWLESLTFLLSVRRHLHRPWARGSLDTLERVAESDQSETAATGSHLSGEPTGQQGRSPSYKACVTSHG